MKLSRLRFGTTGGGEGIDRWEVNDAPGVIESLSLTDYGASILSLRWGGREICLGFDKLVDYENQIALMGATAGPYANRIAGASFRIDGTDYKLEANDGPNSLHSGSANLAYRRWTPFPVEDPQGGYAGVSFEILSPDGDGGFPGNLTARVSYILAAGQDGESYLFMHYKAESDAPTPVNLTNHAYWNLAGEGAGSLRGHRIAIPSRRYVDVDGSGIPTGTLADAGCGNGMMDLSYPVELSSRIYRRPMAGGLDLEPLMPSGYDHCYEIDRSQAPLKLISAGSNSAEGLESAGVVPRDLAELADRHRPRLAARLDYAPEDVPGGERRVMEVYSSLPGLQFYTGNYLNEENGRSGASFPRQSGVCLEAQYYPDSPNQPGFPECILRPGTAYEELTVHRFYTAAAG